MKNFRNKGGGGGGRGGSNVNFYSMDKQEAYNGEGIFDTRVKLGNYESFRHGILGQRSLNLELLPMMLSLPQWMINYLRAPSLSLFLSPSPSVSLALDKKIPNL